MRERNINLDLYFDEINVSDFKVEKSGVRIVGGEIYVTSGS